MTTLQKGDQGELVKRLQAALIGYGYELGPESADGDFGDNTELAVMSVQEDRGLSASGVADEATLAAMDLDSDTLEDLIEIDAGSSSVSATQVATIDGDNIYLDPPLRLWPQWDGRWAARRLGGPSAGNMVNWQKDGCNASSAAMILRWFAEDCTTGTVPFPVKEGSSIDSDWYGVRMAEAFWPNADPPGKIELTAPPNPGHIFFRKLYSVAAHYLKTGTIVRNAIGDCINPTSSPAYYVDRRPAGGWMDQIRTLLELGPVIVGIGAPARHFVVAHGITEDGLLIADPGAVLFSAHNGGKGVIENWSGKSGYVDGTMNAEQVRLPLTSQWPAGQPLGQERDPRSYHHISGEFLDDLLVQLVSVTSLTYPEGACFSG